MARPSAHSGTSTPPAIEAPLQAQDPSAKPLISPAARRELLRRSAFPAAKAAAQPRAHPAVAVFPAPVGAGVTYDLRRGDLVLGSLDPELADLLRKAGVGHIPELPSPADECAFAAGLALAQGRRGAASVVVALLESPPGALLGSTALGYASAQKLPLLLVATTSSSAPSAAAPAASGAEQKSRSRRAPAVPCIPVDRHDVIALYRVAHESLQHARTVDGPTLIACVSSPLG